MVYQPSFRDVVHVFLRRKQMFAMVCALVFLAGGGYLLLKRPLYLSSASLVLHFDSQQVPDIDKTRMPTQLQGSNEHREILYSDADILHSAELIRKTIAALGLQKLYPRIATGPESDSRKMDIAVQAFLSNLTIDVGLQSDVLNISYLHRDPVLAKDGVQQLLDEFYSQEAAVYANPQLQFAEHEAAASKDKLTTAQNTLADFKQKNKIADLPQQVSQLLLSRTDVESRLATSQGRVLEAEQRQSALKDLLQAVPANVSLSAVGEQFQAANSAESRLDQLKAQRKEMASTYLPNSPVFQRLDAQISSLSSAVKMRTSEAHGRQGNQPNPVYESIKTDLLRAQAEAISARQPVNVLTQQLGQINSRLNELEDEQAQYDDLVRAVQIQNDTYKTLAIRYETARVEANRNAQRISAAAVISAPVVPTEPARPRRKLVALGTVVAALLLGIACVLVIEGFDDRFRTPRDVARILRLPVLATFGHET